MVELAKRRWWTSCSLDWWASELKMVKYPKRRGDLRQSLSSRLAAEQSRRIFASTSELIDYWLCVTTLQRVASSTLHNLRVERAFHRARARDQVHGCSALTSRLPELLFGRNKDSSCAPLSCITQFIESKLFIDSKRISLATATAARNSPARSRYSQFNESHKHTRNCKSARQTERWWSAD